MADGGELLSRSRKFTSSKSLEAFRKQAGKKGLLMQDIHRGQPCRVCGDKCPGFQLHVWRKTCQGCKCKPEDHVIAESPIDSPVKKIRSPALDVIVETERHLSKEKEEEEEEMALPSPPPPVTEEPEPPLPLVEEPETKPVVVHPSDGPSPSSARYGWSPDGLSEQSVEEYMMCLPVEKRPVVGEDGMHYWMKQTVYQTPDHDVDPSKCHELTDEEVGIQEDYRGQLSDETHPINVATVGKATVDNKCFHCSEHINVGSIAVVAKLKGDDSGELHWHPQCFVCEKCNELLVGFQFFYHDGQVLCLRHFGESVFPRCHSCDELIFAGSYTIAEEENWHDKHFCCFECDQSLTSAGKSHLYVRHEGNVFCNECYDEKVAKRCSVCHKPITAESRFLQYEEKHMHSACFQCSVCNESLANQQFYKQDGDLLCRGCFEAKHGKECSQCGKAISAGEKSLVMGGRHWHESCFVCGKCGESMVKKPIMEHDGGIFCSTCYYGNHGEKCAACDLPLKNEGGAKHGKLTYHKHCFCCMKCNCTLAGKQFAVVDDDKKVCIDCYNDVFAKKCQSCSQQIEASRAYVSFGDFSWHESCFKCVKCEKSLVGEGFLQREGIIYCSECY
eukprot:m.18108 g.18108  ORF g.18108 m.18108 type:complete len:616 (+) comp27598_c0_seq1:2309-4156(+)